MMKEITKEEVQRAVITWSDFNGGQSPSMRAVLKEFVTNREKEEASEPTITVSEHNKKMDIAAQALDTLARLGNGARFGNSDGNVIAQEALRKLGLSEPTMTPEERVTVGVTHGNAAIFYVDGKIATPEQIKAALIAQLEKESHD